MTSFSIVTVVYNDVSHIKETMDSVVNQSYKEVEYILIDGGSCDGTKETIYEYISSCAEITLAKAENERYYLEATHKEYLTFTFKFLSEKDKGIYDAMNKGIALATKEWINFMNCGDRFYNLEVLNQVSKQNIKDCTVTYGNTEIVYISQNTKIIKKSPRDIEKSLKHFGANIIHQSMFFKTSIHKIFLYNTREYQIASDYSLICQLFYKNYLFKPIPIIVSTFFTGGTSDIYAIRRTLESLKIAIFFQRAHLFPLFIFIISLIKKIIKKYMPNKISRFILELRNKDEC